jgi:hypothetical protein
MPAGSACVSIGDKFATKECTNRNTIRVPMVLGFQEEQVEEAGLIPSVMGSSTQLNMLVSLMSVKKIDN